MIINPNKIVQIGAVKLESGSKIQQNGIDLTVGKVRKILGCNEVNLPRYRDIDLTNETTLEGNSAYDITFNEYVSIPTDMCAVIIIRSSYNRVGSFLTTGLYDAGFKNYAGGVLHTTIPIRLEQDVRLAQIVFTQCDHHAQYDGQYQGTSLPAVNPV